jgi:hypothetical protein
MAFKLTMLLLSIILLGLSSRDSAPIAQSVEQGTENPCVRGSNPRRGTIFSLKVF